jgi:hypothetical protein
MPDGLAEVADGSDVLPDSPHPPTHHTIFPSRPMTVLKFMQEYLSLPWEYVGKKQE